MLTLIYFILILGVIVLVHEFGHFIFSKLFGVYVYEFSIGMGPRIFGTKKKKGKTQYNVRAFPIGGFVSLAGEDPTEKDGLKEESSCDKKNKTLDYSYTFNIKNLNDENTNHDVLAEITQYASEGKIDLDSWMQAAEGQGFTCKKN